MIEISEAALQENLSNAHATNVSCMECGASVGVVCARSCSSWTIVTECTCWATSRNGCPLHYDS